MQRARTAKEKKKEKKKERIKGSSVKENRAKERVSQARWEVAGHPRPHHAKDLPQPWWNQASQNPADEQEYSYYSTEEEGPQAKARIQLVPNPAFIEQIRAGAQARRQGQAQGQVAAPQGPAGEPSSDSSTSDAEDDMPGTSAPNPGEDQDMEASKNKEPLLSPTENRWLPRKQHSW